MHPTGIRGAFGLSLIFLAFLILLAQAACGPVTYNRYQPANPMGKGEFKIEASAELAKDLYASVYHDLWNQMDEKIDRYADTHPEYRNEIAKMQFSDLIAEISFLSLGGALGYPLPNISLLAAYGAADNVDVAFGVTTSGYVHAGAKARLAEFGRNGALAISPAIGYLSVSADGKGESGNVSNTSKCRGNVFTIEAPLLVGWKFEHASPYLGIHLSYDYLDLKYKFTIAEFDPDFDDTVRSAYNLVNLGLVAGSQFKIGGFVITPEVVALYIPPPTDAPWSPVFISPGLALGGQW